jgi:hypothetical protein
MKPYWMALTLLAMTTIGFETPAAQAHQSSVTKPAAKAKGVEAQLTVSQEPQEQYVLLSRTHGRETYFALVHQVRKTELRRQVLSPRWSKELLADFKSLQAMSARKRSTITTYCPEPFEIRVDQRVGWFCESILNSGQRQTWRRILDRLRHVTQKGWEPPLKMEPSAAAKK